MSIINCIIVIIKKNHCSSRTTLTKQNIAKLNICYYCRCTDKFFIPYYSVVCDLLWRY